MKKILIYIIRYLFKYKLGRHLIILLFGRPQDKYLITNQENLSNTPQSLDIIGLTFKNNQYIPNKYSGYGENISPEFIIENISEDTKSILIILQDPDAPIPTGVVHLIAEIKLESPTISYHIKEGDLQNNNQLKNISFAYGGLNKLGYFGPRPPMEHKIAHRYIFQVYTLNECINLKNDTTIEELSEIIPNIVINSGIITGLYKAKQK